MIANVKAKRERNVMNIVRDNAEWNASEQFVTVCTTSRHLFLSWARRIQSMLTHPMSFKIHFNILIPSHPPSFDSNNYIWWAAQNIKLLILHFSSVSLLAPDNLLSTFPSHAPHSLHSLHLPRSVLH